MDTERNLPTGEIATRASLDITLVALFSIGVRIPFNIDLDRRPDHQLRVGVQDLAVTRRRGRQSCKEEVEFFGYFHIDSAEAETALVKLYLYVTIGCISIFEFVQLVGKTDDRQTRLFSKP